MRYLLFLLLCLLLHADSVQAQYRRRQIFRGEPRTEADQINAVLRCLQTKDSVRYFNLFPPFDTLWQRVIHNADRSPEAQKEFNDLKEHPQSLIEFDPLYNHDIMRRYFKVLDKGEDSGLIWSSVVMQRYELQKQDNTQRSLVGYDRIAPERFKGYLFVRDLLNRVTFCITITEIQKLNDRFFGGQVINILQAATIDEYLMKESRERRYFDWLATHPDTVTADTSRTDSAGAANDTAGSAKVKDFLSLSVDEEEDGGGRKEVVDRKYYEGTFDNEIPVKLYVRYMKDVKGKTFSYDGLYKFGDKKNYIRLEITIGADGKWMMEDDIPLGIVELTLKDRKYTGSWTNNDQNGYDAELEQKGVAQKIIEQFDKILDQGLAGRVNEDVELEDEQTPKEKKKAEQAKKNEEEKKEKESSKQGEDNDKSWQRQMKKIQRRERRKQNDD